MYCEPWSHEVATVHADIMADHRHVPANGVVSSCSNSLFHRNSCFTHVKPILLLSDFSPSDCPPRSIAATAKV